LRRPSELCSSRLWRHSSLQASSRPKRGLQDLGGPEVNNTDEDPSNLSSSDHGGHDNRQPKRRSSAKDFGASVWTTQEWKILRASGDISASDDASEDAGKPRIPTKPSRRKTKWSSNLGQKQVKAGIGMLQDQEKAEPFRCLKVPESISWLEPELKKGKAFEDAELRANAAGIVLSRPAPMSAESMPRARLSCPCPMPPKSSWTCYVLGEMTSAKR
jgi:hypothetical protein